MAYLVHTRAAHQKIGCRQINACFVFNGLEVRFKEWSRRLARDLKQGRSLYLEETEARRIPASGKRTGPSGVCRDDRGHDGRVGALTVAVQQFVVT